uniref:Uncharacterized protein n=1 Tax=viral metagenome TaxID=1070528 RepID=A0A6C0ARL5_9ZZZZ
MYSIFETNQICNYTINPSIHYINPKIKHKVYATKTMLYSIYNYDKGFICFDDTESSKYRSVICSYPDKEILCFSPTKSVSYTNFNGNENGGYQEKPSTTVTDIVEGIMVNLFFDSRIDSWEIATKSAIGGKYGQMYNDRKATIYDMFIQALAGNIEQSLNENPIISMLPKWCSYSFVMNITQEPHLTLVAVYNIQKKNVLLVPSTIYKKWRVFEDIDGLVSFPKEYDKIDLKQTEVGFMVQDYESGQRAKILLPEYLTAKRMNKIKPATQYQYLCLRRVNKVYGYLTYFPKQRTDFFLIEEQYDNYVNKVHHYYMEHFVKKKLVWQDIPVKYRDPVYKIHHEIYIKGLSQKNPVVITKSVVKDFFIKKDPNEMAYRLSK